jgi:hypothetical protein
MQFKLTFVALTAAIAALTAQAAPTVSSRAHIIKATESFDIGV